MNKLFTKIGTAMVGIAMAIGVGVAVGRDDVKEAKALSEIEVTVSSYATSNEWADASKYTVMTLDEHISASMSTSSNTGTYKTSDGWKVYESDSGTFTITAGTYTTLNYITITWASAKNNGCLKKGDSIFASATRTAVTGTSVEFTAGHSSGSNKGQVGITKIKVEYTYEVPTTPSITLSDSKLTVGVGGFNTFTVSYANTTENFTITSTDLSGTYVTTSYTSNKGNGSAVVTVNGVAKTTTDVTLTVSANEQNATIDITVILPSVSLTDSVIGSFGYDDVKTSSVSVALNINLNSTVDFKTAGLYKNTGMQMNPPSKGANGKFIYNLTAINGPIQGITLIWKEADADTTPTLYFGESFISSTPASGGIKASKNVESQTIAPASGTNYFFYLDLSTATGTCTLTELKVEYLPSSAGQAMNFADKFLYMNTYDQGGTAGSTAGSNYCKDGENHYYLTAKAAYNKLTAEQKTAFASLSAAKARYEAWAVANNDNAPYDGNDEVVSFINSSLGNIGFTTSEQSSMMLIITIISIFGIAALAGTLFLLKKKKDQ